MSKRIFLILCFLLLTTFIPNQTIQANSNGSRESDNLGILTDVNFMYDQYSNKKNWIPEVTISEYDYSTGARKQETFVNSDALVPVKKGQTLAGICSGGYGNNSHLILTKGQLVAYWDSCYTVTKIVKGKEVTEWVSKLFSFDLNTKKWSLVTNGNGKIVTFYPNFRGYAIYQNWHSDNKEPDNTVEIYSLDTKKLLKKVDKFPFDEHFFYQNKFSDESKGKRFLYYIDYYDEFQKKGAFPWIKEDYWYKATRRMSLSNSGETKEISEQTYLNRYPFKIGNMSYDYEKSNDNTTRFGYRIGKTFYPLHDNSMMATASFSPSNKYFIMTLIPRDRNIWSRTVNYSTFVYHANSAKLMYEKPMYAGINYNHFYAWLYGDEVVRINFWLDMGSNFTDQNLHIKSGVVTGAQNNRQHNIRSYTSFHYSGDYNQLLSPDIPAEIYFNDTRITYSGQGSFIGENGQWYVPIRDFADSLGIILESTSKTITLSSDRYKATLNKKDAIVYNGRSYFPYPEVIDQLGGGAISITDYYNGSKIDSYTADYSEQELLENDPELKRYRITTGDLVYLKKGTGIDVVENTGQYNQYSNAVTLTFKDGLLINVNGRGLVNVSNKGIDSNSTMKDIIASNGKGTRKKITNIDDLDYLLYYPKKNSTLVYSSRDGEYPYDTVLILNQ